MFSLPKISKKDIPGAMVALQMAGLLSALIFALSCGFEVLHANTLHSSQYIIIALLQCTLALWAIIEIYSAENKRTPIPLASLKVFLWLQLALILARHIDTFYGPSINSNGESIAGNIEFGMAIAFAPAYLFVFLAINKLLINAFAHAEHLRANQLEQARLELQRKLKTSLVAASVAHEINQPLSTMLLNIHLAEEDINKLGPAACPLQSRLAQLTADSKLVVSTIETMRTLLRNVQTEHSVFDLSGVVLSALKYQRNLLRSKNIALTTLGMQHRFLMLGDESQLQIAVGNLLRNAVEALEQEGIAQPQLEVSLSRRHKQISLQVADNGPGFVGISLEQLPMKTTKRQGSGLGLYVVHTAVENNGGSMNIGRSEKLGGAEVTLMFPTTGRR